MSDTAYEFWQGMVEEESRPLIDPEHNPPSDLLRQCYEEGKTPSEAVREWAKRLAE